MMNMEMNSQAAADASAPAAVHVWLVDDNDQLRTLIARILEMQGGITCARQFSSPDEMLSTLASRPGPDVILMDVQMGDRNGLDAVRPVRSLTRSTRVLMFTTGNHRDWRERALGDGASDYLLKSSAIEDVAERIHLAMKAPVPARRRRRPSCSETNSENASPPLADRAKPEPPAFNRVLKRLRVLWR